MRSISNTVLLALDTLNSSHLITYDFFKDSWFCGFAQFLGDDVVHLLRFGRRNAGLLQLLVKWSVTSENWSGGALKERS